MAASLENISQTHFETKVPNQLNYDSVFLNALPELQKKQSQLNCHRAHIFVALHPQPRSF